MRTIPLLEPLAADLERVERKMREPIQDDYPQLAAVLESLLGSGGKRLRPALALLAGSFYPTDSDKLVSLAASVEMLHTATLVHDDLIDGAFLRRGRQTVNARWNMGATVLTGDYLFARAGEFCANTGNLRAVTLFAQTLATISNGELRQSFDAFNLEQTRQQYLQRISRKTASLFTLATESGAVLSQAPARLVEVLREYGHNLGIAFQIVDDVLDYTGSEEELGKPVGSDLAQGTLTLPAMLLLERHPEDNPVKRIFENQNQDQNKNVKMAIELIRNSSIVEECHRVASEYCSKACYNLKLLPDNASRQAIAELADYVIERKV